LLFNCAAYARECAAMKNQTKRFCVLSLFASLLLFAATHAQQKSWYKGNTHAHTINSDGILHLTK
jgi:hypothetical protein